MSGLKKYLIISTVLLVLYLLAQYFKPKPTNWAPTYLSEDKIPFGTYILRQRINDIFPNAEIKKTQKPVYNTLKEKLAGTSNYLIIASKLKIDKLDYREMIRYMESGNNIFISAFQISGVLPDTLKLDISSDFNMANKQEKSGINFTNPALHKNGNYYFDKGVSQQYFEKIDSVKAIVLGKKEDNEANFIQYKFGKGSLFIMPNPQLLTNYNLLKPDGLDYASKALSYLPKAQTIIWDEHFTRPDSEDTSPLRVIFNNPPLKWAYYIALFGLLAFIFFEIKRRQRIIPVITRPSNTSVEFVKVVGRVYYQQRDNRDIAEKKVKFLFEYIRNKYKLRTLDLDQEFKEKLTNVSDADPQTIENLLIEIYHLKKGQMVSDQHLINLNKVIEQFYKQDQ
ncbi:DUF4350 domain-containing protein [Pedobacter punctiformis]|uniref:DUF4350 domain-containing protein n=1 Tax=Pedobacter punctiformis TaxID=3004097 RepID=A0ABT4L694_9SPHI|nr:DUF4350 domain-containing protein [Pedobacter sp. HCMS5-2]MCZ4243445.1 DUF4350 domain-containing protein [Pedobacter sp. HCMS5-2]